MEVFDATVRAEEEGDIQYPYLRLTRRLDSGRQDKSANTLRFFDLLCLSTTLLIRENSVLSKEEICLLRDVFHFVSISV